MQTYEPKSHESVEKTAGGMVAMANKLKQPVKATFTTDVQSTIGNIELTANPGDDPSTISLRWLVEARSRLMKSTKSQGQRERGD